MWFIFHSFTPMTFWGACYGWECWIVDRKNTVLPGQINEKIKKVFWCSNTRVIVCLLLVFWPLQTRLTRQTTLSESGLRSSGWEWTFSSEKEFTLKKIPHHLTGQKNDSAQNGKQNKIFNGWLLVFKWQIWTAKLSIFNFELKNFFVLQLAREFELCQPDGRRMYLASLCQWNLRLLEWH